MRRPFGHGARAGSLRAAACTGAMFLGPAPGAAGGTRPSGMTGCGQRPRETERAPDAKEINVPADDKQRVGRAQRRRRARRPGPAARGRRGLVTERIRCRRHDAGSHVSSQRRDIHAYSASRDQPCLIQPSRGSAARSGWRCWQSHQVPPGHFSWCCCRQDKQIMSPLSTPHGGGESGGPAGQAALARRIRRRRSAERSSSFSPPQVPYFSGRLTA
jgi:hypothetical protein